MKQPLTLEQSGLIIELFSETSPANYVYVTYSACTHGGWAKYLGIPHGDSRPVANLASKSEVIADANQVAKYYNRGLLVLI